MAIDNCPRCQKKMPPPFSSSNRQVCANCGWSDKPNKSSDDSKKNFVAVKDSNKDKHVDSNKSLENPALAYENLINSVDFTSNKVERESKKLIGFLICLQWFLVIVFFYCGLYLIDSYEAAIGFFILIIGTVSSYFSVQVTIIVIKLLTRIEFNTRLNQ